MNYIQATDRLPLISSNDIVVIWRGRKYVGGYDAAGQYFSGDFGCLTVKSTEGWQGIKWLEEIEQPAHSPQAQGDIWLNIDMPEYLKDGRDKGRFAWEQGYKAAEARFRNSPSPPPQTEERDAKSGIHELMRKAIIMRNAYNSYIHELSGELFVLRGGRERNTKEEREKAQQEARDALSVALKPFIEADLQPPSPQTENRQPFEQYPVLSAYIQEIASSGQISNWTGFLFEINELCRKIPLTYSKDK